MRLGILGGGSFGTAMAALLGVRHEVTVWCRREESAAQLRQTREYPLLPGIRIGKSVKVTASLPEAAQGMDLLLTVVPSYATRETARLLRPLLPEGQKLVNLSKGLEDGTHLRMSQVLRQELPSARIAALTGPSHAEEVGAFLPTTNVAASEDAALCTFVQDALMSLTFRVYRSDDMIGAELGGALKNVIALCAGICDGLGCGHNAKAALITRGIAEIARLGVKMGARRETFAGLSGIGDLIVTCTGDLSRNRRVGELIGRGMTLPEAQKEVKAVAEGVYTARAANELAVLHGVEMLIIAEANAVLFGGRDPGEAVSALMGREKRAEF